MKKTMRKGVEHTLEFDVTEEQTVANVYPESELFQDMPPVFATAYMVGFIEWACMTALKPYLEKTERSVGVGINVSHEAATPVGMKIKAMVKCTAVDGMKTTWSIKVFDEKDLISKGTHERFTIDNETFLARLNKKTNS